MTGKGFFTPPGVHFSSLPLPGTKRQLWSFELSGPAICFVLLSPSSSRGIFHVNYLFTCLVEGIPSSFFSAANYETGSHKKERKEGRKVGGSDGPKGRIAKENSGSISYNCGGFNPCQTRT